MIRYNLLCSIKKPHEMKILLRILSAIFNKYGYTIIFDKDDLIKSDINFSLSIKYTDDGKVIITKIE